MISLENCSKIQLYSAYCKAIDEKRNALKRIANAEADTHDATTKAIEIENANKDLRRQLISLSNEIERLKEYQYLL